jgi:O-antigen/teichoic acid export membrane protein
VAFAPAVILVWTGENVPDAAWALQVMASGHVLFALTALVSSNMRARGMIRLELITAILTGGLVVTLFFPMARWLHFEGVIYTRLIAQVIGASWYLASFFRFSKMPLQEYLQGTAILRSVAVIAGAGLLSGFGSTLLPLPSFGVSERWHALFTVALWSIPYVLILGVGVWRLVLDGEERERIAGIFQRRLARLRGRS